MESVAEGDCAATCDGSRRNQDNQIFDSVSLTLGQICTANGCVHGRSHFVFQEDPQPRGTHIDVAIALTVCNTATLMVWRIFVTKFSVWSQTTCSYIHSSQVFSVLQLHINKRLCSAGDPRDQLSFILPVRAHLRDLFYYHPLVLCSIPRVSHNKSTTRKGSRRDIKCRSKRN